MTKKTKIPSKTNNGERRRSSLELSTDRVRRVSSNFAQYANPNEQDKNGVTPLIHLLYHRMVTLDMTRRLIEAGADPNIRTRKGNDVFDALLRKRTYKPESGDIFETAKFLLNGARFWSILGR